MYKADYTRHRTPRKQRGVNYVKTYQIHGKHMVNAVFTGFAYREETDYNNRYGCFLNRLQQQVQLFLKLIAVTGTAVFESRYNNR